MKITGRKRKKLKVQKEQKVQEEHGDGATCVNWRLNVRGLKIELTNVIFDEDGPQKFACAGAFRS